MKNSTLQDTTPAVNRLRLKLIANLSPEQRAEKMNRLCAFGKLAMLEGLRESNPDLSSVELHILLAKNMWGEEFANHIRSKLK